MSTVQFLRARRARLAKHFAVSVRTSFQTTSRQIQFLFGSFGQGFTGLYGEFFRFSMLWSELATVCCAYHLLLRILSVWETTQRRRRGCCGIGACSEYGVKMRSKTERRRRGCCGIGAFSECGVEMRSKTIPETDRRAHIPSPWRWPEGILKANVRT